ncbi:hypothetical protein D3C71_1281390 [compost metagenome]
MVLQGGDFAGQLFDAVKRHDADFRVFQGHCIAGVVVIHDAIKADDLACHLKTRDLVTPVFGGHTCFEEAGSNGIERSEGFAVAEKGSTAFDLAANGNDLVNALQLFLAQPHRHAQLAQVAVGAGDFDGERVHRNRGWVRFEHIAPYA